MPTIGLALDFLWEFLDPILSDAVKEKIRPKSSPAIAKERAYKLYKVLSDINVISEAYIKELKGYVEAKLSNADTQDHADQLYGIVSRLSDSLTSLDLAISNINPQLEIHYSKLHDTVWKFHRIRRRIADELQDHLRHIHRLKSEELQELLSASLQNQKLIAKGIKQMREFLAAEFPFKESF